MKRVVRLGELLPDGFIDPKLTARSFVVLDDYSPAIRFRLGWQAPSWGRTPWAGTAWRTATSCATRKRIP